MQNKLLSMIRQYDMLSPGDSVICAVSGGADSVALLFALYLLKDRLGIRLEAAHFNHRLRGQESDEDEAFVRGLCSQYDIPLHVGTGEVKAGKKGLEAAAREARYAFLRGLPGKIATAHTADDNAETVLMRLIRGTGLKGLGAIAPVSGRVIRPMLLTNRQEVEDFLAVWGLPHREDSSNAGDDFLRNRIRHSVMPLLRGENPGISLGLSAMARRLRQDEESLQSQLEPELPPVSRLRQLPPALQSRYLERFLKQSGIPEPEQSHIGAARALLDTDKPSARMNFPGGVTVARDYDRLMVLEAQAPPEKSQVSVPGAAELPEWGIRVCCAREPNGGFGVSIHGSLQVRSREPGDSIRLSGGTKSLKKLMIDHKISAPQRSRLPILADDNGVLWAGRFGANLQRLEEEPTHYLLVEPL